MTARQSWRGGSPGTLTLNPRLMLGSSACRFDPWSSRPRAYESLRVTVLKLVARLL